MLNGISCHCRKEVYSLECKYFKYFLNGFFATLYIFLACAYTDLFLHVAVNSIQQSTVIFLLFRIFTISSIAIWWRYFYVHNNGTYSNFPFQSLWIDRENQKHSLSLQSMRTSQVSHNSATVLFSQFNALWSSYAASFQSHH